MQITQHNIPTGMIDLGVGQPSISLLPLDKIKRAAEHRMKQGDASILQYGVEQGSGYFRHVLSQFLSGEYRTAVDPDQLFITAGASQGLDLICTHFAQAGDTVFVEEPSYFLALRIFADHRLKIISLPIDENGLVIDALEEKLTEHKPAFVYTIPTFHNPSSVTLSASRRERLIHLSEKHGFLIIADEVYHLLAYTVTPSPPMVTYDTTGAVLSLGSFSKILAPGLRLGWIQAKPVLVNRLTQSGLLESGGGLNPFASSLAQSALERGLQRDHLAHLKRVYRLRSKSLSTALNDLLPSSVTFTEPGGGFFIWLRLPDGADTEALRIAARQQGVNFQPGPRFSSRRSLQNYLRLSFVYYDIEELREGSKRLASVLDVHT
ncbi:MAG: PLP-dependent aminotransferase family protein [Deltaproteobacteria bacterium]|nr:PLP-dependent aminotransferase family protein [Deltaproteobacteria bacterium]MBW2078479.1 PLP-dependent aminotransferase family protein [Deltaproteobacteria bacterium]